MKFPIQERPLAEIQFSYGRQWTGLEDEALKVGYLNGVSYQDLARDLGRSVGSVKGRAARLGIRHPKARKPVRPVALEERRCLSCGRPFMSWGSGNRICHKCRCYHHEMEAADTILGQPYEGVLV